MYSHVDAIEVSMWGRHVGTIVPKTASRYRFEYDAAFLRSGIEIAPFELPLGAGEFSFLDRPASAFYGLPAVFADSLPDSFGNSVIDARRSWTNCHAMSINGKQSNVTDDDLLEVAERYAIGSAESILGEVKAVFS